MNNKLILWCAVVAMLAMSSAEAELQDLGGLNLKRALDGHVRKFTPGKLVGGDIKTPRKGAPYLYVAWRQDGESSASVIIATFNAMQDSSRGFGLGLLLEVDGKTLHYASRCSPRVAPKCDPATQGMRHDEAGKKVQFNNTVFDRVSLQDTDPKDTLTVTGELRYAN